MISKRGRKASWRGCNSEHRECFTMLPIKTNRYLTTSQTCVHFSCETPVNRWSWIDRLTNTGTASRCLYFHAPLDRAGLYLLRSSLLLTEQRLWTPAPHPPALGVYRQVSWHSELSTGSIPHRPRLKRSSSHGRPSWLVFSKAWSSLHNYFQRQQMWLVTVSSFFPVQVAEDIKLPLNLWKRRWIAP